jgi:hypothetical protein
MINAKLQSIIDTKSAIGNAINNKGGTITTNTPFFNYAAQIDGISTGTPQTIFAASDGSKWALSNVVNLVNSAGNVTYDFNRWQPANNSTSDPILNVGTVNANISGNIRIVQVNQVNQAQYGNIVATAINSSKYVGYNGYDSITNPTPSGNVTFNRWVLNNSASGTIVFANTVLTSNGTYNGPNFTANIFNMALLNNSTSYGGAIHTVTTNNGFVYIGGNNATSSTMRIRKYFESNLNFSAESGVFDTLTGNIQTITTNNGFIYAAGLFTGVKKVNESTLSIVGTTNDYLAGAAGIISVVVNNGFIYAGGGFAGNSGIKRWRESNLAFVNNSSSFSGNIRSLAINNGFIYACGDEFFSAGRVSKYHESNLALVGSTPNFGTVSRTLAVNNGFIYAGAGGGTTNNSIQKFHESNLVFVGNTSGLGTDVTTIKTNNGFLYGPYSDGSTPSVRKFYESNLTFVSNTTGSYGGSILNIAINNSAIFVVGSAANVIRKYQEQGLTAEQISIFTATKIKE